MLAPAWRRLGVGLALAVNGAGAETYGGVGRFRCPNAAPAGRIWDCTRWTWARRPRRRPGRPPARDDPRALRVPVGALNSYLLGALRREVGELRAAESSGLDTAQ